MRDSGTEYRVTVEVPGATRDSLEIEPGPMPGTLALKVDSRKDDSKTPMLSAERGAHFGVVHFQRIITVGPDGDVTSARPTLLDGILTIVVPKRTGGPAPPDRSTV